MKTRIWDSLGTGRAFVHFSHWSFANFPFYKNAISVGLSRKRDETICMKRAPAMLVQHARSTNPIIKCVPGLLVPDACL